MNDLRTRILNAVGTVEVSARPHIRWEIGRDLRPSLVGLVDEQGIPMVQPMWIDGQFELRLLGCPMEFVAGDGVSLLRPRGTE